MHATVLEEEAAQQLVTSRDGCYIDATFGRGGHSAAILEKLSLQGRLLAIDRDPEAIAAGRDRFGDEPRLVLVQGNFSELSTLALQNGFESGLQGVLLDLGVSSPQLDQAERGFSFLHDGPLDMRMNPAEGLSAADWLARADAKEIQQVLRDYGEEKFAGRMARAIVAAQQQKPITRTSELAAIVAEANPAWEKGKHPATRAFQAIRIFINAELEALESVLVQAVDALTDGGRLVVISFHSLEDRIVKRFIREQARGAQLPRRLPVTHTATAGKLRAIGKATKPGRVEVESNPRARSAIMRVAEKI